MRPGSARSLLLAAALALGVSAPALADDEGALLVLSGMTYVASNGDINEVVLDADRGRIIPEQDVAHLEVVRARLSGSGGNGGGLDLTCDRGTFDLETGDFIAEGNVLGTTGDGRRFRTTRLRYRHRKGLVSTKVPVLIRDDAGTYRGGGFDYYVHENRFRLVGGATVVTDE